MLRRSKTLLPRLASLAAGRSTTAAERLFEGPVSQITASPSQTSDSAGGQIYRGELLDHFWSRIAKPSGVTHFIKKSCCVGFASEIAQLNDNEMKPIEHTTKNPTPLIQ